MSLADPHNAGNVFEWAIQGLDALQESGRTTMGVAALEASGPEQLTKIGALESLERKLLDIDRRFEHQLGTVMVDKECYEPLDVESTKAVIDAKVELANAKEA